MKNKIVSNFQLFPSMLETIIRELLRYNEQSPWSTDVLRRCNWNGVLFVDIKTQVQNEKSLFEIHWAGCLLFHAIISTVTFGFTVTIDHKCVVRNIGQIENLSKWFHMVIWGYSRGIRVAEFIYIFEIYFYLCCFFHGFYY